MPSTTRLLAFLAANPPHLPREKVLPCFVAACDHAHFPQSTMTCWIGGCRTLKIFTKESDVVETSYKSLAKDTPTLSTLGTRTAELVCSPWYVETYQNAHVETAHSLYVQQWASSPIKFWQFADQPTCHQAHERRGRPATPLSVQDLVQQHKSRNDSATWGFVQQALPMATTASVLDRGYNPLTPSALYRHHPEFDGFHVSQATFDADYLVDFVGTKTLYKYDCADWGRYRRFYLSRRIPCERHDAFKAMGVGLSGIPLLGDLPIMDEEYFEWVSLIQAVNAYVARSESFSTRPFVVAEFGARYGTWAARGARAVRSKIPDARVDVCVVEGDPTSYKWMITHLERNVPPSPHHFVLHGIVANTSGDNIPAISWEAETTGKQQQASNQHGVCRGCAGQIRHRRHRAHGHTDRRDGVPCCHHHGSPESQSQGSTHRDAHR